MVGYNLKTSTFCLNFSRTVVVSLSISMVGYFLPNKKNNFIRKLAPPPPPPPPQVIPSLAVKAHFHSGKFSAERKICKMWLADTNFPWEKNFEVENFQLLNNDIFGKFSVRGNFSWVEMGPNTLTHHPACIFAHLQLRKAFSNPVWA
jgi:hypothetical protein